MQDRFKFRAWDENNEIMHYDYQAIRSLSKNGWLIFQSDKQKLDWDNEKKICVNVYPNPYFAEQLKIMQCTGLKDKNSKLVYENDIVKLPFLDPIFKNVISDKNTELAIVEYYNGCFTAKYVDDNTRVYLYQFNENIEVIGNIFENEELVK